MLKNILILSIAIFIFSCGPSMKQLQSVQIGMDRSKVVGILGEPTGYEVDGSNWKTLYYGQYYFIFDHNDKLNQFSKASDGSTSNSFMGVVTVVK